MNAFISTVDERSSGRLVERILAVESLVVYAVYRVFYVKPYRVFLGVLNRGDVDYLVYPDPWLVFHHTSLDLCDYLLLVAVELDVIGALDCRVEGYVGTREAGVEKCVVGIV